MITWFDVPKEGMSPGSKAIIPTGNIELTENGEGIDVSTYATASVNVSGGGGGGDFSTATVTITSNPPELSLYRCSIECPIYEVFDDEAMITSLITYDSDVNKTMQVNAVVPNNGYTYVQLSQQADDYMFEVVEGDAELDGVFAVDVRGNCTIEIVPYSD